MQTTSGRIHISFLKQIILQRKTFSLYNNIYTNLPYNEEKRGTLICKFYSSEISKCIVGLCLP